MQNYIKKKQMLLLKLVNPGQVTIATNMAGRGTDIKLNQNSKNLMEDWQ